MVCCASIFLKKFWGLEPTINFSFKCYRNLLISFCLFNNIRFLFVFSLELLFHFNMEPNLKLIFNKVFGLCKTAHKLLALLPTQPANL